LVELAEGESGEIFFNFRKDTGKHTLLVNPRPQMPRFYMAEGRPPKKRELSPFAQSLRNAVLMTTVESVSVPGLERIVKFGLSRDRTGERYDLIFEMAGKKPNLLLVDDRGRVALAQSYISISEDAARAILPDLLYEPPPKTKKLDAQSSDTGEIAGAIAGQIDKTPDNTYGKALFSVVGGISPLLAAEAVARASAKEPEAIANSLKSLIAGLGGQPQPCIIAAPKGPVLSAFPLAQFCGCQIREFPSMSAAAEAFFDELIAGQKFNDAKRTLVRNLAGKLSSAQRKVAAIEADLARGEDADYFTTCGNLLMAQLNAVPNNAGSVKLPNLFGEGELDIALDPKLSPVKNAEAYFRKARKARAGVAMLTERLAAAEIEADALRDRLEVAEAAEDISDIEHLAGEKEPTGKKRGKAAAPMFPSFRSSDGFEVFYAKNAKANDLLTFKFAQSMDLWLHAQGYHGAHVIVRNPERRPDIPLQTILEAAQMAAFFSGAKKDSAVAVDYTFRKYVRKPKDPVPGQAMFTNNKTVFVEPKKR
ncbi:MAG TPA: NFACT family protein, partial [Nitrospirota bacterium]